MSSTAALRDIPKSEWPNIEKPRWTQETFWGRARHFFTITNPLNLVTNSERLETAKNIVEDFRHDKFSSNLTIDELWRAKHLYDSAFHPETKEKMILIGRMSSQVPMNMSITGCMMTFYKTTPSIVLWQWINQSFNAIVNYTNRSGSNSIPNTQLLASYCAATGGALTAALGLNTLVKSAPPLIGRFVPWCAVATANAINIPMMRYKELEDGIVVLDENGNQLGSSRIVARRAISQVVISRICMATPGMVIPPFIMNHLDNKIWLKQNPYLNAPIQVGLVGIMLIFATPLCCALFPQISSISITKLEPELQEKIAKLSNKPTNVYYNKGL